MKFFSLRGIKFKFLIKASFKAYFLRFSITLSLFQDVLSLQWLVVVTITLEELVLHLDPMESEAMQEALHLIHAHDNCEGN